MSLPQRKPRKSAGITPRVAKTERRETSHITRAQAAILATATDKSWGEIGHITGMKKSTAYRVVQRAQAKAAELGTTIQDPRVYENEPRPRTEGHPKAPISEELKQRVSDYLQESEEHRRQVPAEIGKHFGLSASSIQRICWSLEFVRVKHEWKHRLSEESKNKPNGTSQSSQS